MARYSTSRYGAGKYGKSAVAEAAPLTWLFLVDWNGDGVYEGANEAAWITDYSLSRGREGYLDSSGGGFDHMQPAQATLTMDNTDGRYDPRNAASPLSPNVYPGKKCQIAVLDNSTDPRTRYTRITGYIDSIMPMTGRAEVQITVAGNMQIFADQELTSKAAHIGTSIHDSFVSLFHEAGYPGGVLIDADSQPVISFAVDRQGAASAAGELADASLGHLFEDVQGRAVFYARNHTYPAAMALDEDQVLRDFVVPQPWEGVFNQVDVVCRKQIREQPSVVFFLSNPLYMTSGTTAYIYPSYGSASNIEVGKLEANSQADGGGADRTNSVSVNYMDLGPMGGTVQFYAGADLWVTKFEIRGRAWKEVQEKFSASGASRYGNRKFTLDSPFLQDRNYALSFKGTLAAFLDDDREDLTVEIEARPSLQFAPELLSKIHFTSAAYNIDATYWVMGIRERWLSDTGQAVRTTLYLSKICTDSTSITPAAIEEEIATPLGYDNPAGDPQTTGTNPDSKPLTSTGVSVFGQAVMGATTELATFTESIFNPDVLISVPSTSVTIKRAGWYVVSITGSIGTATDASNESNNSYGHFRPKKNGSVIADFVSFQYSRQGNIGSGVYSTSTGPSGYFLLSLAAGDVITVEVMCYAMAGTITASSYNCFLTMYMISEA